MDLSTSTLVNTAHLDHLYEDITVDSIPMAIIHIYSNFPDYQWIDAEGEGITCVDDVARAIIFYLEQYKVSGDIEYRKKVKKLVSFLQYMQAANGWFYNFMKSDYSINTTYKTSVALPTWWTWRALWAISETALQLTGQDGPDKKQLQACMTKSVQQLLLQQPDTSSFKKIAGLELPTWLPYETGADQAAVLILFLLNYYKLTGTPEVLPYIKELCSGIILMQQGDKRNFPHYALLSWENNWHGWGNSQSYALLQAYAVIPDPALLTTALNEIDNFYNYLYQQKYLNSFSIKKVADRLQVISKQQFSQIAYGLRPMIWACLQAGVITGDARYDKQAGQLVRMVFRR